MLGMGSVCQKDCPINFVSGLPQVYKTHLVSMNQGPNDVILMTKEDLGQHFDIKVDEENGSIMPKRY